MPLDLGVVGARTEPWTVEWDSKDALLYALGVGAGAEDPAQELALTTENTEGVAQQVLPTFPVVLGSGGPRLSYGDIDLSKLVHAEQSIVLHRPLPVTGRATMTRGIDGMYDKGSGALVTMSSSLVDAETGEPLADMTNGAFIRGEGGFGGDRSPTETWAVPDREPDAEARQRTRIDQALLYRLSGDRNPLHSDPAFARRGGWPRPILHGLCTFGFVGRALLHAAAGSDPVRFRSMRARFSRPVMPGDELVTRFWFDGTTVLFQTRVGDQVVLDRGVAEVEKDGTT
ncbi:MaoC/PaaZ C-terminal domain-containing protein [Pseudonocardia kunmingensis]|uniref:Acyl dehydratase n=1 Tax=Pseudonocardia kunmingensis TaxID=630975 RepID=A0A543DPK0_9PSEU|nr:MaoC/PaaZ C-terminal domain-containing protein [Pseudonocardia kunmingensis]TQM11244.1 acyl dehydratase [Pseudonocardia kunmingensis]